MSDPDLPTAVDAALTDFLTARRAELAGLGERLDAAADALADFLTGGKRLRPRFCWWGWRAGGGRADPADCAPVVQVAAALELIQACALIHDDIVDRSQTRRGRPSLHRAAAAAHAGSGWNGDADHHGVSVALLLGDLALAWADDLFHTGAGRLGAGTGAQHQWREMRTEVLGGQLLDLFTTADPAADPGVQLDQAYRVIRLKTAGYTVLRPLLLGAALAAAGQGTVTCLHRYGTAVGTAFQLRDDLLGVFGDPSVTGKPAGDDLVEGKRTVLLAAVRRELTDTGRAADLADLDAGLGTVHDAEGTARLTAIIASTAAPQRLERRIDALVAEAATALEPLDAPVAAGLRELAGSATARVR